MFFIPGALILFLLFIIFLPILFILGYFHIITIGFERLGISQEMTVLLLLAILVGSLVNIPLGKRKLVYVQKSRFFGLWRTSKLKAQGLAINLGGGVIPILLSFYFLYLIWQMGFGVERILVTTILMVIISKFLSRVIPGVGISIPLLIPPVFSAILALIFAPGFAAPCAFISGTLGVLIGGDILNLKKAEKQGGFLSIGGAGVFDGIFLVGVVSALLTGL